MAKQQPTYRARERASVEYPGLVTKVIKQVRFTNDDDYIALVMDFEDNSSATFNFRPTLTFAMEPEISVWDSGNMVRWKKLVTRPIKVGKQHG